MVPEAPIGVPAPVSFRPVTRADLLRLAAPAAASGVLNNAFRVIDQYAAGSIGTSAQAAIGACTFVLIATWAICALVASGAGPLVARATGAGDHALRRRLFGGGLVASVAIGLGLGVLLGFGANGIAAGLGLTGEVAANAATFLQSLAFGGPFLAVAPLLDAVLVALGHTGTMMALQLGCAALNALLNHVFLGMFGMGIEGTAAATVISRGLTAVLGVVVVWRELRPTRADLRPDQEVLRQARLGLPITLNTLMYAAVYFALLRWVISPLGAVTNAALGIGFSALEGLTYPAFLGVSLAVSSLVGRQLGAGRPEEAVRAARLGVAPTLVLGLFAAAVFGVLAEPLCGLFTHDPDVLAGAVLYAHILAWSQLCVAVESLAEGVLAGAGDNRTIFWLSAPLNLLRVPLAWVFAFSFGWGAAGVWWAINLTSLLKAVAKGIAAARGGWSRIDL